MIDVKKTIRHLKRYNLPYFQHKAYDLLFRRKIASGIGRRRLETRFPGIGERHRLKKEALGNSIAPFYREYIRTVSSEIMASSLELSVFLLLLCDMAQPQRMLDLGSGFSSFLLRYHARNAGGKPVVWSVDDSAEWLEKTSGFLAAHNLPASNLATWDEFIERGEGRFDFIFYDLGPFPLRMDCLRPMLETMTADHGMIVLDDMHAAEYGRFVKRTLKGARFQPYDTGCYTRDRFNRFSLLLTY